MTWYPEFGATNSSSLSGAIWTVCSKQSSTPVAAQRLSTSTAVRAVPLRTHWRLICRTSRASVRRSSVSNRTAVVRSFEPVPNNRIGHSLSLNFYRNTSPIMLDQSSKLFCVLLGYSISNAQGSRPGGLVCVDVFHTG